MRKWSDLGNFDAMYEEFEKDGSGMSYMTAIAFPSSPPIISSIPNPKNLFH